jgi:hypothetical protein
MQGCEPFRFLLFSIMSVFFCGTECFMMFILYLLLFRTAAQTSTNNSKTAHTEPGKKKNNKPTERYVTPDIRRQI